MFAELEQYGVRHEDRELRNVTYRTSDGRFCLIDFEFATLLDGGVDGLVVETVVEDDESFPAHFPFPGGGITARRSPVVRIDGPWPGPTQQRGHLSRGLQRARCALSGKNGRGLLERRGFCLCDQRWHGQREVEFASRITVDRITRLLPRSFRLSAAGMTTGFTDILSELFSAIHQDLLKLGASYEECSGMGATLSLCWFTRGYEDVFGHLGGSRICYLPNGSSLNQLTHDHSHVGWLHPGKGQLNEREARTHPRRNALQQALGQTQFAEPHIGAVAYLPGDRFLLCSDGLTDGLWDRQLGKMIRQPSPERAGQNPAERLVAEADLQNSGRDNTTAMVIEIPPSTP